VGEFFSAIGGIGVVLCLATPLILAVCHRSPPGPCFCDPMDIRTHWRGAIKLGLGMIAVALIGGLIAAIVSG
jgi:hypothetical protein